ncbi:hypothetical protein PPROV_001099900 [Pycnococcus provasolii]|uniref:EF-hand domain-containing protein n=1 Tax=Pycnococcus provasolii TaxID=41880 RepID=A0A830I3H7_9CHLO|nr:hypothetical protein PPROV_001099900 [Pycnococcus provasolii]|mmetsp:Transcript_439/g.1089  ORF Transcript_439/g.1089 Transcript_439/m.1089 type:complete len:199 (+) Transcript_439:49-645(+)
MGISQSTLNLTQSEVDEVHKYCDSILTAGEIESLYRRFRSLDKSHKGFLGAEELVRIPEVALNPLSHRLCVILDGSNFKEFCDLVASFSPAASPQRRYMFLLQFLDIDGDGVIGVSDIIHVLRQMAGTYLDENLLEDVANAMLVEAASLSSGGKQTSSGNAAKELPGGVPLAGISLDILEKAVSSAVHDLWVEIPRAW